DPLLHLRVEHENGSPTEARLSPSLGAPPGVAAMATNTGMDSALRLLLPRANRVVVVPEENDILFAEQFDGTKDRLFGGHDPQPPFLGDAPRRQKTVRV